MADSTELVIVKYVAEVEGLKAGLKSVQASVAELTKSNEELAKKLADTFKKPEEKVQSLKSRLRELKAQLAEATDPKEIERLAKAAGQLSDQLQDAGDAAKVFASESKFEQIGTALGGVGGKLRSLDFKGALDQSKLLVSASKGLTFKEGAKGIADLGATLGNVGKALLTNPIFLLGAAIALIATNFDKLKTSGGAVGTIFTGLDAIIKDSQNAFIELSDAIGLTNTSLSDYGEAAKAINEIGKSSRERVGQLGKDLESIENKTNLNLGKITEEQYKKREAQLAFQKAANDIAQKNQEEYYKALEKAGIDKDAKDEKSLKIKKQIEKNIEMATNQEATLIQEKYQADLALIDSEAIAKQKEKNQKASEERIKQAQAEADKIRKIKQDASAQLAKEAIGKNSELEIAKANEEEKLLITKSAEAERLKEIYETSNKTLEDKENLNQALLDLEEKYNIDLKGLREKQAADKKTADEQLYKEALAELEQYEKEAANAQDAYDAEKTKKRKKKEADEKKEKDDKKKAEKQAFDESVQIAQETINILDTLSKQRTENELAEVQSRNEKEQQLLKNQLDANLISKIKYDQLVERQNKKIQAEEAKIKKEAYERDKSIALANAIIQTAVAAIKAYSEGGPIAGPILAALAAAAGAIQIAAIENAPPPKFEKGGKVKGNRHFAGGTLIEAEKDEFIINRKEAIKHDRLLEAINNGRAEKYIHEMYLAPVLKQTAKRIKEQQQKDFATNIANSMMLQGEFKDVNILDSLKMSRQNDREIAQYIVKHISPNVNKYNW